MKHSDLSVLSNEVLVARFRDTALEENEALLDSDIVTVNRLVEERMAIDAELRVRGTEARKALLILLDDDDWRVRFEAARMCLAVAPERALTVIKEVKASEYMPVAAEASATLRNLADGIFKPT